MKNNYKNIALITITVVGMLFFSATAFAQNGVRIAGTAGTADPSAMLDIVSSNKGVLFPRVCLSSLTANSSPVTNPQAGLVIYNTGLCGIPTTGLYFWNGSAWVFLNTGGFSAAGTTNQVAKFTASNAIGSSIITDDGTNVGIGITGPSAKLHVAGGGLLVGTTGSGSVNRTLTVLGDNTTQISFGSYPYDWSPALQIQNNDNTKFTWISAGGSGAYSAYNARYYTSGSGLDFYTGSNAFAATITSAGGVGIGAVPTTEKLLVNGTVSAPGLTLQTKYTTWTATTTATTAYTYIDATGSDVSITAKRTGSIFKITVQAEGYYAGAAGTATNIGIKYVGTNTQICGVSGTSGDSWQGNGDGTDASSSWNLTRVTFHNPGTVAGTTYTYRAMLGIWAAGTSYLNYPGYNSSSTIIVEEIGQ